MVRIDLPLTENQTLHYYTIEARRRFGYDHGLTDDSEGVVVHEVKIPGITIGIVPYSGFPQKGVGGTITLAVGDGFYDSANGVSITVHAKTDTGYQVIVGFPTVASVTPNSGPEAGNQAVTIHGQGFPSVAGDTSFLFGANPATGAQCQPDPVDGNLDLCTATTPPGTGAVPVTATVGGANGVRSADPSPPVYIYAAKPTVTRVDPPGGLSGGQNTVVITGTGFAPGEGDTSVAFGSVAATLVQPCTTTQCTVQAPADSSGIAIHEVDVRVTVGGQTSDIDPSGRDQYTYYVCSASVIGSPASPEPVATYATVAEQVTNCLQPQARTTFTAPGFAAPAVLQDYGYNATNQTVFWQTDADSAATYDFALYLKQSGAADPTTPSADLPYILSGGMHSNAMMAPQGSGTTAGAATATRAPSVPTTEVHAGKGPRPNPRGRGRTPSTPRPSALAYDQAAPQPTASFVQSSQTLVPQTSGSPTDRLLFCWNHYDGPSIDGEVIDIEFLGPTGVLTPVDQWGDTYFNAASNDEGDGNGYGCFFFTPADWFQGTIPGGMWSVLTVGEQSGITVLSQINLSGSSSGSGPTVTSLSPGHGSAAGGDPITIQGTNFSASGTTVSFGGTAATVQSCTLTQCAVTSPPGSGQVNVVVTVGGASSATGSQTLFSYDPPTVGALSTTHGGVGGGTAVTISGTNFSASGATVAFGSAAATNVSCTATNCTVTSPPGTGQVNVVVAVSGMSSQTGSQTLFTYDPPSVSGVSPTSGPAAGGTAITITGSNLNAVTGGTQVSIGGVAATGVQCASDGTSCTAATPATSGSGGAAPVVVTVDGVSSQANASFSYDAAPPVPPTVGGTSATVGAPGTTLTITGTNFSTTPSQDQVTFNGKPATVTAATATQLTVTVPTGATSGPLSITTPGGAVTAGDFFVPPAGYSAANVVATNRMSVGSTQTETIGTANGIGLVVFDGTASHRLSVQVSGVTIGTSSCCSAYVSISNPDGSTLAARTLVGTGGGFLDAVQLPMSGTGTIAILPQNGATGSLTLQLNDVPADAAASITPGGAAVTISTSTAGQNAQLGFAGNTGQRVSVQLTNVTIGSSTCCSTFVSIRKPDGSTLVSPMFVGTSGGFVDTATLPVTGSYTVFLDPQSSATGSATLTLFDVPADAAASISPGGAAASVTTTVPGQNAQVTFGATAGQRVSLQVTNVTIGTSACCSTFVSIANPDGSTLAARTFVGTSGGFLDVVTAPVAGTYTIALDPQGTASGSATLTLYDVPADASTTATPGGAAVTLSLATPGQNGQVGFSGAQNQRVSLALSAVTVAGPSGPATCCSSKVSLLKPDGSTLVAPTFVGTSGGFIDSVTLPVAGTYTVVVDPQGADAGSMTLQLYDVPADANGTLTVGGGGVTLTVTVPGQNARLALSGTAGQSLNLSFTGVTVSGSSGPASCCSTKVSVLTPDGSKLISPRFVGTSGGSISIGSLPVDGSYTIVIDAQGDDTGSVTVAAS